MKQNPSSVKKKKKTAGNHLVSIHLPFAQIVLKSRGWIFIEFLTLCKGLFPCTAKRSEKHASECASKVERQWKQSAMGGHGSEEEMDKQDLSANLFSSLITSTCIFFRNSPHKF